MDPTVALAALGFTDLEARLYCELLRQSPLTGYKLAQIVAKAPANTYQALNTLSQKGAVIVSEGSGETKTYSPVPARELVASLAQSFEARREAALDALTGLQQPASEERVYQLQTASQALERARGMFDSAKEIVLFDFFPEIYEMMEPTIRHARERGIVVAGITYQQSHDSPMTPCNQEAESVISRLWPGLGLIVVADAAQQLMAQISKDKQRLLNGVWSDSAFLSATYHSALAAEIRLTAMRRDASDPLGSISLFSAKPPGLRAVLNRRDA